MLVIFIVGGYGIMREGGHIGLIISPNRSVLKLSVWCLSIETGLVKVH